MIKIALRLVSCDFRDFLFIGLVGSFDTFHCEFRFLIDFFVFRVTAILRALRPVPKAWRGFKPLYEGLLILLPVLGKAQDSGYVLVDGAQVFHPEREDLVTAQSQFAQFGVGVNKRVNGFPFLADTFPVLPVVLVFDALDL